MRIKIIVLSFITVLITQSCGDEHQFLPEVEPAKSENPKIKFIHAASDTVGVNLFLDGLKITGNVPSTITTIGSEFLGQVNVGTVTFQNAFPVTNYTTVENTSGTFNVVFPESYSATKKFNAKTLSSASAPSLDASSYYTVAFMGISGAYETVVYSDDLSGTPIDGNIYVRFGNFLSGTIPQNLTLVATPPVTTDDPTPARIILFENIPYKAMTGFVTLPRTGTYTNVQLLNPSNNAVIATLATTSTAFATNKVYTVFARGRIGGTGSLAPGVSRAINR